MAQVTAPVRLSKEEYKKYRRIALDEGKSFAELVREALKSLQKGDSDKERVKRKMAAAQRLWKSRIPIDIPITELIHEGRRFEDE